jgi:hypothetical protein
MKCFICNKGVEAENKIVISHGTGLHEKYLLFHEGCFEEVAGHEYLDALKNKREEKKCERCKTAARTEGGLYCSLCRKILTGGRGWYY